MVTCEVACHRIPISQMRKPRSRLVFHPSLTPGPVLLAAEAAASSLPKCWPVDQDCLPESTSAVPGSPDWGMTGGRTDGRALSTCVCCFWAFVSVSVCLWGWGAVCLDPSLCSCQSVWVSSPSLCPSTLGSAPLCLLQGGPVSRCLAHPTSLSAPLPLLPLKSSQVPSVIFRPPLSYPPPALSKWVLSMISGSPAR